MKLNITLEEWEEMLAKPENKAYNQLNIIEGCYRAGLLNFKDRRKARREMRNLRKQLAKFELDNSNAKR